MTEQTQARVLAALQQPDTFTHPVESVQVIQTHISWVFLAGDMVYKVKKPLDLGFLDFTTLRKRRYYCQQEVVLNRRLCPDVYLGIEPIRDDDGIITLGEGRGRIVEYAVMMRRLPEERMLDRLVKSGQVTATMIDDIARILAGFHREADAGPEIARYGSIQVVRRNWDENFEQTRGFIGDTITYFQFRFLQEWIRSWLQRNRRLLKERQAQGRVRDGHGDLRTSAICVQDKICIYDCIEFNRRFRYADVAADMAFLVMDLKAKGRPDLADRFVKSYARFSSDMGVYDLLPFYACYRAYVRGKVESLRAVDPQVPPEEQHEARTIAVQRFRQAVEYPEQENTVVLLITCGLSGTGKSAVAGELAQRLSIDVVLSDRVRKELAGAQATERRRSDYGAGIYSPQFTRRTYRTLLDRGRGYLMAGKSVILDATFSARAWRQQARDLAEECGALFLCLECRLDEAETRSRLKQRERDPDLVSDATWETYLMQRSAFEPVNELDEWQHVVLSTDGDLGDTVERALGRLQARLRPEPVER